MSNDGFDFDGHGRSTLLISKISCCCVVFSLGNFLDIKHSLASKIVAPIFGTTYGHKYQNYVPRVVTIEVHFSTPFSDPQALINIKKIKTFMKNKKEHFSVQVVNGD